MGCPSFLAPKIPQFWGTSDPFKVPQNWGTLGADRDVILLLLPKDSGEGFFAFITAI